MEELGTRLLLIDGECDAECVAFLRQRGYRVETAQDAQEGLALIHSYRPDLVLLEVMLPSGSEGFHLVWELRGHPDPCISGIPVVVVSAIHQTTDIRFYPDMADPEYAPGEFLPIQDFLEKPCSPLSILATVQRLGSVLPTAPETSTDGA